MVLTDMEFMGKLTAKPTRNYWRGRFRKNKIVCLLRFTGLIICLFILACGPKPGPDKLQRYQEKAGSYIERQEYGKAIGQLRKVLAIDEKNAAVHRMIAECYRELGQPDSAITYFQGAIVFNSRDRLAYEEVAEIYFDMGDYQEAMSWYDRALQMGYIMPESYVKLGMIHQNWQEYNYARRYYDMALLLDSTNADALYGLGSIAIAVGDTLEAEIKLNEAYLLGNLARAALRLALIADARNDYDDAIKWYDRCIAIEEESELAEQAIQLKAAVMLRMKAQQK